MMDKIEKFKVYTVTKGSTDGTIRIGDIVWLSENGDLNIVQANGWLTNDEWNSLKTKDFEVKPCEDYYLKIT